MAITTLDGMLAGFVAPAHFMKRMAAGSIESADVLHSLAYTAGYPGPAVAPTPGSLAGAALTSYAGQLPWTNPGAGNSHLARLEAVSSQAGSLFLVDRLWHNDSIVSTTTGAQTINSAAFPARDANGSTNGAGVLVGLEVSTATTNGSAITNTTLDYTNSAGTASRTGTIASFPATATVGTFVPFSLAAGDLGVRSIQGLTLGTSYGTGVLHLVAYRVLGKVDMVFNGDGGDMNFMETGFPRLYDNTVPFLMWLPQGTSATNVYGSMTVSQG